MRRAVSLVCLILAAALLGPASVLAKSEDLGGWSPAATLATGRAQHTATLLGTGKVLIAGGVDAQGVATASAELFDPALNRWAAASPMLVPRTEHTATLLNDGRVLVVGGFHEAYLRGLGEAVSSAEVYDPRTNRWTPAASMAFRRARHTATLLLDGRVLVLGGISLPGYPWGLEEVGELYDPLTNRWSETAPGIGVRQGHTASLLPDGRVLVVGGLSEIGLQPGAKLYDPVRNTWTAAASPAMVRDLHTATVLPDGRVLLLGGVGASAVDVAQGLFSYGPEPEASGDLYDSIHNLWIPILPMNATRAEHTATLLRDGSVLAVGGAYANPGHPEIYEVAADHWVQATAVINRHGHTATLLPDGRVLIAGGFGIDAISTGWIYRPHSGLSEATRWGPIPTALVLLAGLGILLALIWGDRLRLSLRKRLRQDDPDQWIAS